MNIKNGIFRLKVIWAVVVLLLGIFFANIYSDLPEKDLQFQLVIGISVASVMAAIIPFLKMPLLDKFVLFWFFAIGFLGYAFGGVGSITFALITAVIFYLAVHAFRWVIHGFRDSP